METSASAGAYRVSFSGMIARPSPITPSENTPSPTSFKEITLPVRNAFSSAASITFSVLSLSAVFCPSVPCPISAGESFFFPTIKVSASGTANAISMQTAKLPIYFG